jgi:predicted nucleotidyltransferase
VRLEPATLSTLVEEIRAVYGSDADIWLFGSRTDDQAKGGDIDLYVETSDDLSVLDRYLECRRRLFQLFGDRKVDLVIRPRGREPSPIERIARKTGIKLSDNLPV